ncbi:MAG: carboxylesterase family protein [Lachnospiraceae bacterium]|nr:carboxylesterase family protein [Lachnospiraceae bacterium]
MLAITTYGVVKGIFDGNMKRALFAGIPYAKPPIGELRFRAPQPPDAWMGVRDCTSFGPAAMQKKIVVPPGKRWLCYGQENFISEETPVSEDCLYLNVWTPMHALRTEGKGSPAAKLPVLVIFHGGGFTTGAGSVPVLNGGNFSEENVVVVTVNYRLGIFGFLTHPALSKENDEGVSGNYGILDQIMALRWVRNNIEAFGGDPECVTIAGESAGGGCVSVLYQSPLAKGLFQRAFAQSGALFAGISSLVGYREVTLAGRQEQDSVSLAAIGVTTAEELRKLDAETLMKIQGAWGPNIDGWVLPGDYSAVFGTHAQNDVPLLLGSNSDEGLIFTDPQIKKETFTEEMRIRYGERGSALTELYLEDAASAAQAAAWECRERMFEHHMYIWARMQAACGLSPVWLYYFDRAVPDIGFGAFHSSALPYFYKNQKYTDVSWEETDRELSGKMSRYLRNFIYTGNPNEENPDLPVWQPFSGGRDQVMELGEHCGMITKPHKKTMDAMTEILSIDPGLI